MKKFNSTSIVIFSLTLSLYSCDTKRESITPSPATNQSKDYTVDGAPQPTKIGSTNAGDIYTYPGSGVTLNQCLQVLASHRQISYAQFDTTTINVTYVSGGAKHFIFASATGGQTVLAIEGLGTSQARL